MNLAKSISLLNNPYGISKVSPVFCVKYSTEQRQKRGLKKKESSEQKDERYDGIRLDLHHGEEEKISPIMYNYGKVLMLGGK